MESLSSQITLVAALAIVSIVFLPIYLMRRKMRKMTDDDLKKIDLEDWKKQIKSNAYIKLISRNLWGLFLIVAAIYDCWKAAAGLNLLPVLTFVIGIIFMIWGFLGYQNEMKKL
jgi:steroid 5-alpha reductase family enzyme